MTQGLSIVRSDQYHLCRFCTSALCPVRDDGLRRPCGTAAEKPVRVKSNFAERIQADLGRPVVLANIYFFSVTPNQWLFPRVPSRQEGRIAIVTNARRDVVDAAASARKVDAGRGKTRERSRRAGRTALKRTAKPCGSGTRGWCQAAGGACDPTGSVEPSSRQRWRQEEFVSRESSA